MVTLTTLLFLFFFFAPYLLILNASSLYEGPSVAHISFRKYWLLIPPFFSSPARAPRCLSCIPLASNSVARRPLLPESQPMFILLNGPSDFFYRFSHFWFCESYDIPAASAFPHFERWILSFFFFVWLSAGQPSCFRLDIQNFPPLSEFGFFRPISSPLQRAPSGVRDHVLFKGGPSLEKRFFFNFFFWRADRFFLSVPHT